MAPFQNITIEVPDGSFMGANNILCSPTKWSDIVLFLLINYGTHLATIRTDVTGDGWMYTAFWCLWVMVNPFIGILQSQKFLYRLPIFAKTDLEKAALSQALVVVARKSYWAPDDKDEEDITGVVLKEGHIVADISHYMVTAFPNTESHNLDHSAKIQVTKTDDVDWDDNDIPVSNIQGLQFLPLGFGIYNLPPDTKVQLIHEGKFEETIAADYNILKILASMMQIIFGSITLYRSRGDQFERWGYAAPALTVIPFVFMSMVNLATNLVVPNYPAKYLVSSPEMEEAKRRGGIFDCVVGAVVLDDTPVSDTFVGSFFKNPQDPLLSNILPSPGSPRNNPSILSTNSNNPSTSSLGINDPSTSSLRSNTPSVSSLRSNSPSTSVVRRNNPATSILRTSTSEHHFHIKGAMRPIIIPPINTGATLYIPNHSRFQKQYKVAVSLLRIAPSVVGTTLLVLVEVVVWLLTRFKAGESTLSQRVCSMLWIASNFSMVFQSTLLVVLGTHVMNGWHIGESMVVFLVQIGAGVAGYYTVISMLLKDGTCSPIY